MQLTAEPGGFKERHRFRRLARARVSVLSHACRRERRRADTELQRHAKKSEWRPGEVCAIRRLSTLTRAFLGENRDTNQCTRGAFTLRCAPRTQPPFLAMFVRIFQLFSASLSLSLLPAQQRHSVVVGNSLLGIYRLFLTRKRKDLHFYRLKAHQLHSSIRVIVCLWMWRQQFNVMIYCTCDSNRMIDMCQNKRITSPAANAVCDRLTIFIGFTVHLRNGLTCFGFMSK